MKVKNVKLHNTRSIAAINLNKSAKWRHICGWIYIYSPYQAEAPVCGACRISDLRMGAESGPEWSPSLNPALSAALL